MERKEAVELLRMLAGLNLVSPSFVSLKENKGGKFDLIMKSGDSQALKQLAAERDLVIEVDVEKGYCIIHKP